MATPRSTPIRENLRRHPLLLLAVLLAVACAQTPTLLESDAAIHLESHLESAEVRDSGVPATAEPGRSWSFPAAREEWAVVAEGATVVDAAAVDDALRLRLEAAGGVRPSLALVAPLPDWDVSDWEWVVVTARATGAARVLGLRFNQTGLASDGTARFALRGDEIPLLDDGAEHSYRLRVSLRKSMMRDAWRQLGLHVSADGPSTVELLRVEAVRTSARYATQSVGVGFEERGDSYRRVLFAHTPAAVRFRTRIPPQGRLDVGLGVLDPRWEVRFRVLAKSAGQQQEVLLDATRSDPGGWDQRSVDLSRLAGRRIDLTLEVDAAQPGTPGLWAAPTLSGAGTATKPNVLLYVIDGGGADLTSLYGDARPTTPFLVQLASEGATFERAHSNSSWTKPSTSTLLTSLHHSVLGGTRTLADPLPENAETLPEILHAAGYLTAAFTSNPFAGRVSNFERGLDRLRDADTTGSNSTSSVRLHQALEQWRREYPGRPFYAHIQTTDVHRPHRPQGESAGRFLPAEERERFFGWQRRLEEAGGIEPDSPAWEATGIDRQAFYDAQRLLFEECLAHNDARLAELVSFLKEEGEWDRTLLIVTSDHGVRAAGLRLAGHVPGERVLASAYETRIPLVMTWPGQIPAGLRIADPVSLIDVLPTVLDLVGLPPLDAAGGHSLAPLLVGRGDWSPRPVILDEFDVDGRSGELHGLLEVIDGRWAASLMIGGRPPASGMDASPVPRITPFLLFDLERDPYALEDVHEDHPELTRRYVALLRQTWREHQERAKRYRQPPRSDLTADQLRTLRTLGYID